MWVYVAEFIFQNSVWYLVLEGALIVWNLVFKVFIFTLHLLLAYVSVFGCSCFGDGIGDRSRAGVGFLS